MKLFYFFFIQFFFRHVRNQFFFLNSSLLKKTMPLTHKFRSTTIFNAFILNSIVVSMTALCSTLFHHYMDKYLQLSIPFLITITVVFSFSICMILYLLLYHLFGYGGGMLVNKQKQRKKVYLFK